MEDKVLDLIIEVVGEEELRDNRDIDLFETGLIDSLMVVHLIVELEDEFDISISPTEIPREEFNTPNAIIETVRKKVENE